MNITVKAHKLDHKKSVSEYAEKKLEKLSRFFDHIQDITIDLDISQTANEDDQQCAAAVMHVSGTVIRAEEQSSSMYASIDLLIDKLEVQLKKYKEKLRDEHRRNTSHKHIQVSNKLTKYDNRPHKKEPRFIKKPMSPEEAAMVVEEELIPFLVFRNIENEKINVIYPQENNEYGLIET
ncbi:ribosome-associated translation inhibitor RaiA [Candidatus Marinamargulisbacteria bacterium SCGC AAA071-K20]|nr:ribosome-associated translation inhibitor RaiA [Candidatus Marinamargulisbacteria bacterium SCGC AAA071-K20]